VPADRDVRQVDAELGQAVGQPRAVAVAHTAGEDLGARHDDARAGAHPVAQGLWPGGSTLVRCGVSSYATEVVLGGTAMRLPFAVSLIGVWPMTMRIRRPRNLCAVGV